MVSRSPLLAHPHGNSGPAPITVLLRQAAEGDVRAKESLWSALYEDLHRRARRAMATGQRGATLQPTALVHEVWLRMDPANTEWRDREHFLATSARAMRQVLVDAARARRAAKRTPPGRRESLEALVLEFEDRSADLHELDAALSELAELDPDAAQLIELRFFAGASMDEAVRVLEIPKRSLERSWRTARAWLAARLA